MLFDDTYFTIEAPIEGVYKEKGSKFISFGYPISTDDALKPIIVGLKAEHPKADHHCYALRLTPDRSVFRINDDGEPPGTAGRPILNFLLSKNLTNVLVVVVRYFGGTLLGVPGLINAYRSATHDALKSAKIIEKTICDIYSIQFEHQYIDAVMRIVKNEKLTVINQNFNTLCELQVCIRKSRTEPVIAQLKALGKIIILWLNIA